MASLKRPDPDALLERVQAQAAREQRAKLKLFFGFAPGVGKTYRMLQAARELARQGGEVLVGVVETHGRRETAALLDGLELLPRKQVPYRGRVLEELDLEAALRRRPPVIVVDELAHTNAPGSRHPKRYEDVLDLLDAGIDVLSTLNVQHIESLNDVVAQITGVSVRETVPDSLLERADEIELIDVSPEELLARLKEGKVYLAEQAERAAQSFFKRGNLLALRELALRQAALHVDTDVQEYRAEHGVDTTWPVSERVLVSAGPSPASGRLVRAARRMAAGLRAPWVAAYVEAPGRAPLREADRQRLEANLRLAETLGAAVVRLSGQDVAGPLVAYARRHNVTRIVIGKPTHARLRDRLRGSLLDDVVRASADIDVHVISGDVPSEAGDGMPESRAEPEDGERSAALPYLRSAGLVLLTSALGALLREAFALPDVEMLFFVAIMLAAALLGRGPAILAAALSVAAFDFFFVPPHYTFSVADARYVLTFAMMFAVGYGLSELVTRLRRQELDALAREERAAALYGLSRSLGPLLDPRDAAQVIARQAAQAFAGAAVTVLLPEADALVPVASEPAGSVLGTSELGVARWVLEHLKLGGRGTSTLPGATALCAPLAVGSVGLGVLAVTPAASTLVGAEQRSFLEAFARQASFALERARLAREAREAALRARTEELRSTLLSAVSHDLRTPLAAITGAASSLRDDIGLPAGTRADLLESICEEAERLERLVGNLLDMTRLEAGGLGPRSEYVPVDEILGAALTRLERSLRGRDVHVQVADDVPLVEVDPVLMQQLFVNLLENAAKYTPAGSPIDIRAARHGDQVLIDVCDRGPGLGDDYERVFEKFFRRAPSGVGGVGLGLAICRAIAIAHRGRLGAAPREGGGTRFRLELPVPREPIAVEADDPLAEEP